MADKEIVDLASVDTVTDDILIPCYVPGSSAPAQKVYGAQLRGYAELAAAQVRRGATYTPVLDEEGNLFWTNDSELPNPDPINIMGPPGGANSFNNRQGEVLPQTGDYTADMVGAAPAGYGLGGVSRYIFTVDELNALTANSNYLFAGEDTPVSISGHDIRYGYGRVDNYEGSRAKQTLIPVVPELNSTLERYKQDGTWGEWEWVNPPMEVGVEYRTTERFRGQPVCTVLVAFGSLPNASYKTVQFTAETNIRPIRCVGIGDTEYSTYPSKFVTNEVDIFAFGNVICANTNVDGSALSAYAQVWYTKVG